jgi:hypothetical protein
LIEHHTRKINGRVSSKMAVSDQLLVSTALLLEKESLVPIQQECGTVPKICGEEKNL